METLQMDNGIREYRINASGILRFNPSDPNVYARFLEAEEKIAGMEQELLEQAQQVTGEMTGSTTVRLLAKTDARLKELLGWVFGEENDFDRILGGVNLLAVAGNGERVITNLFAALAPVLTAGAEQCARQTAAAATAKAEARRAKQG